MDNMHVHSQACDATLRWLDCRLKNEPVPEEHPEILAHLKECSACSREAEARVRTAERLAQAVRNQPVNPYLETRISSTLREHDARRARWGWSRRLATMAAVLAFCLGGWIAYQLGHLRVTTASQDAYISAISERAPRLLRVGLGDHVHCAVFRKFPKEPPRAAEMHQQLGPEFRGLLSVLRAHVPDEYRILMAHRCSYRGRKFVHFALKGDSGLLSLVITTKDAGESFTNDGLRAVTSTAGGLPIYEGSVRRFAVAGFETADHLAYLVSDLGPGRNRDLLAVLAPSVRSYLSGLGG